jgi:hypothetical protein
VAVAVVVDEGAAGVPANLRAGLDQAGLLGDVGEGAVAVVAIERVLAVVGDEEIVVAVVVVVADAAGLAPAGLVLQARAPIVTSVKVPSRLFLKRWQRGSCPAGKPSSRQPLTRKRSSQPSLS